MEDVEVRPLPERRRADGVRTGAIGGPAPPEEEVEVVALDSVVRDSRRLIAPVQGRMKRVEQKKRTCEFESGRTRCLWSSSSLRRLVRAVEDLRGEVCGAGCYREHFGRQRCPPWRTSYVEAGVFVLSEERRCPCWM